jgi:transposase
LFRSLWFDAKERHKSIEELMITLDNGSHIQSHRTQFIKRITEFADQTGLAIRLVYYPPYHSKYNPIERGFGILEQHWNGTLLDSVTKAIEWAKTMTWKGIQPIVYLIEEVYQHGVTLTKSEMEPYEARIQRSESLPKWDVSIMPDRSG